MLTSNSLKSPYVKAVFRKLKTKKLAQVEKVSTNINLLCFDFMDFMNELCDVYDEVKLINNFNKKEN